MKSLFLLLACLAIASATSYVRPPCGYTYYSIQRLYISTPASCFRYKVYDCRSWHTTNFYSTVMKIYPGKACLEEGFEETSLADFTEDCQNRLNEKADEIKDEITEHFTSWKDSIEDTNSETKARYLAAITKYTDEYLKYVEDDERKADIEKNRDDAITAFNKNLDDRFADASTSYDTALQTRYDNIVAYHDKILNLATKCYNDRLAKIQEYEEQITERITDFLGRFKETLATNIETRVASYKALLYKVHDSDTWEAELVPQVVDLYKVYLEDGSTALSDEYKLKLDETKPKLIKFYTCAYQCSTYSGCLSFSRRSYFNFCRSIGKWWSFKYSTQVPCYRYVDYKFTWVPREYKNLATCDLDTINVPVADVEEDVKEKTDAAIETAQASFDAAKIQLDGIGVEYIEKYTGIVEARHIFLVESMRAQLLLKEPELSDESEAEIAEYERQLGIRKTDVIADYKTHIEGLIATALEAYTARLEGYKTKVNGIVTKVSDLYSKCLETRETLIKNYETKQTKVRDNLKICLEQRLEKVVDTKSEQYHSMLLFYHKELVADGAPEKLYTAYKTKITAEYETAYLSAFDEHWGDLLAKLVHHYSCRCKCVQAKFYIPVLKYCLNWRVSFPTATCYRYQYNYFCSHKAYVLRYSCGVYTWRI